MSRASGELAEILSSSSHVGRVRFFGGGERAEVVLPVVNADRGGPAFPPLINALEGRRAPRRLVEGVFAQSCLSQIGNAIVGAHTVHVVNQVRWHDPGMVEPSYPVSEKSLPIDREAKITSRGNQLARDGADAVFRVSARPGVYLPRKNSRGGIVVNDLAQAINRQMSRFSCQRGGTHYFCGGNRRSSGECASQSPVSFGISVARLFDRREATKPDRFSLVVNACPPICAGMRPYDTPASKPIRFRVSEIGRVLLGCGLTQIDDPVVVGVLVDVVDQSIGPFSVDIEPRQPMRKMISAVYPNAAVSLLRQVSRYGTKRYAVRQFLPAENAALRMVVQKCAEAFCGNHAVNIKARFIGVNR